MLRINDKDVDVFSLGLRALSYNESGGPKHITDFDPRKRFVRSIVFHTTSGSAKRVVPGAGAGGRAKVFADYQVKTDRFVSWDGTIDTDGLVLWQNDPAKNYSWHATSWNSCSLGIEIVQEKDGTLYQAQIDAAVLLADVLTATLGIQRQLPWDASHSCVMPGVLPRADEKGSDKGTSLMGVFAHFHNTQNRGAGDPGRFVYDALYAAGYEGFDVNKDEDRAAWRQRQKTLGLSADGLPFAQTHAALKAAGKPCGIWVPRPCDAYLTSLGF